MTDQAVQTILRPHLEDSWCDSIFMRFPNDIFCLAQTVERWKTSGLSVVRDGGDEWRFSYHVTVMRHGEIMAEHSYGIGMETAMQFAPKLLFNVFDSVSQELGETSIQFFYKGTEVYSDTTLTPRQLLLSIPSIMISISENTNINFYSRQKSNLKEKCCQPGCLDNPEVFLQLKKCYDKRGQEEPNFDHLTGPRIFYRQFCQRHKHRGDCGLDDSDQNYLPSYSWPFDLEKEVPEKIS